MILICPSCDTRYFAEDSSVGKDGRKVRCAACGCSWFARPGEEAPAGEAVAGLSREQVERLRKAAASAQTAAPHAEFRAREMARRKRNRAVARFAAWSGVGLVFAGVVVGALNFRDLVACAWPETASAYKIVGLDVNRFGLELADVEGKRSFEGTTPVLTVTGAVVNPGDRPRAAPLVRIALLDEAGAELHAWTDRLAASSVEAGGRAGFSSRVVGPPLDTVRLAVSFAPDDAPDGTGQGTGDAVHSAAPTAGAEAAHTPDGDAHAPEPSQESPPDPAPAPEGGPPGHESGAHAADPPSAGGEHH